MIVFIPGDVPSSKNSRQLVRPKQKNGRSGKPIPVMSGAVKRYMRDLGVNKLKQGETDYKTRPNLFRRYIEPIRGAMADAERPILLGFYFARKTLGRWDIDNAKAIICDLLVVHKFIEDDNADVLVTVPMACDGQFWELDRKNPGVWLEVLNPGLVTMWQLEKWRKS